MRSFGSLTSLDDGQKITWSPLPLMATAPPPTCKPTQLYPTSGRPSKRRPAKMAQYLFFDMKTPKKENFLQFLWPRTLKMPYSTFNNAVYQNCVISMSKYKGNGWMKCNLWKKTKQKCIKVFGTYLQCQLSKPPIQIIFSFPTCWCVLVQAYQIWGA